MRVVEVMKLEGARLQRRDRRFAVAHHVLARRRRHPDRLRDGCGDLPLDGAQGHRPRLPDPRPSRPHRRPAAADRLGGRAARVVRCWCMRAPETIRILHSHIFNWLIWPDFSRSSRSSPARSCASSRSRRRAPRPWAGAPSPRCRRGIRCRRWPTGSTAVTGSSVFSGDTAYCPELIAAINACPALRHLILETAFAEEQHGLAVASRHLCPSMSRTMLDEMHGTPAGAHQPPQAGRRRAHHGPAAGGRQPRCRCVARTG